MSTLDSMIERERATIEAEDRHGADGSPSNLASSAQRRLASLVARQAERDQAVAEHERAEREHADELVLLGQELADERATLAERVSTAVRSLTAAYDAARAYDATVAGRAEWLRTVGLAAAWRERTDEQASFGTGAHAPVSVGLGLPRLVLNGHPWHPADPADVVRFVVDAVAAARQSGVRPTSTGRVRELLDGVVELPRGVAKR